MAKTAGSSHASWLFIGGLGVAFAIAQPLGCTPLQGDGETDGAVIDAYTGALERAIPDVVLPALRDAREDALALQVAAGAWSDAPEDPSAREATVDAWRDAVTSWHRVEVMQLGPLAPASEPGGQDLRDAVYSWPDTVNPCRVDQETAAGAFSDPGWADGALVNVQGFDAMEQLLFGGAENVCPSRVPPNSDDAWETLGADGVRARRAAFAAVLADGLVVNIDAAIDAMDAFAAELSTEGGVYADQRDAMNAVYRAVFYMETVGKDRKLAQPLGLRDCDEDTCPEDVEHLASGQSLEALRANLDGFEALFFGGDGIGMDDVLEAKGHGDISASIRAALADSRAKADALDRAIDEGLQADPEAVRALHDAVKAITDEVKGDVATVLSMSIPSEAAGDND